MARVRNETFYATLAQVLPTLMIALAVELYIIFRNVEDISVALRMHERARRKAAPSASSRERETELEELNNVYSRVGWLVLVTPGAFLVGEFAAVAVLFFGTKHVGLISFAGPACLTAVVVLTVAIVVFPFVRLAGVGIEPDGDSDEFNGL